MLPVLEASAPKPIAAEYCPSEVVSLPMAIELELEARELSPIATDR